MGVKHAHQTTLADDPSSDVSANAWNADHSIDDASIAPAKLAVSATDTLIGRATSGAGAAEEIALTAAGRALIDDASAAVQRTTLGVAYGATGDMSASAEGDTVAAGSSGKVADAGHRHAREAFYSSTPAVASVAGSAGSSASPAHGDHAHPRTAPVRNVYTSTGDNTWTKPANVAYIEVEMVGAGGGGGACAATGAGVGGSAPGAAGGGYSRKVIPVASLTQSSYTAHVGAKGTGGAAGANAGTAGGDSTFSGTGLSTITGSGGGAGAAGVQSSANTAVGGPSGGAASGGDLNVPGSDGGPGTVFGGARGLTGDGGASHMSGRTKAGVGAGNNGKAYGGGGSGAQLGASASAAAGGDGADGVVIVTEFYF